MSLIVSWVGIDSRGPASMYIAGDSRISWGSIGHFDHARKVFAFRNHPDIIGYCGDVLFPSIVLGQIAEMADSGLLFRTGYDCKDKFESVKGKLVSQFMRYPRDVETITDSTLQVVYCSRETTKSVFRCFLIEWSRTTNQWTGAEMPLPTRSDVLFRLGSGALEFNTNYARYAVGTNAETSRNVFQCFCDTLNHIKDPHCGGAPQLVGIYRKPKSGARTFGIIHDGKRFLLGAQIDDLPVYDTIEWRNDLFELCDGDTRQKKVDAAAQPDPLRRT